MKKNTGPPPSKGKAVVPVKSKQVAKKPAFDVDADGQIVPGEYKTEGGTLRVKKIEQAKHYDVISVARSMNEDFGNKVKTLFDPEREAAFEAIKTGLYMCWRPIDPPYNKQDCQRINQTARCFCDHLITAHDKFTGSEPVLKCLEGRSENVIGKNDYQKKTCSSAQRQKVLQRCGNIEVKYTPGCCCKAFSFVPSRPEEVGEFWLRKRRAFDPVKYRIGCRCKHTTAQHKAFPPPHKCLAAGGCGCTFFYSASVCAACDQHWHLHHTVLETEKTRKQEGRPVGQDWLPFAELPDMCHMALTGEDRQFETLYDALPEHLRTGPRPQLPSGPNDVYRPGGQNRALPVPEHKPDYLGGGGRGAGGPRNPPRH